MVGTFLEQKMAAFWAWKLLEIFSKAFRKIGLDKNFPHVSMC